MKKRKAGFVLAEALVTLILVSTALCFEYEQLKDFNHHDIRLKKQYQEATQERINALEAWYDYAKK
ncbi:hypothetical protein [Leuconostoc rapi]|uniref:hypothetical protein n=1 Tax=Leuconostoc rapi TaxID=1406906 RepID=UPI001EF9049E|nr:hypothetical protein [Leuconostoc rapi]MBM7436243.1 hypothetical protein [Leuconostoc rapi]